MAHTFYGTHVTRWRVDHEIKSDIVLVQDQNQVVFVAPNKSHEIYLKTRRGSGQHAADELFLSSHLILEDNDPRAAAARADDYLDQFLETLSVISSAFYRIKRRVMVADWTSGLTRRRVIIYKEFPNPHVPLYGLSQDLIDSVAKLSVNPIPLNVRLAMARWSQGVAATSSPEQFQYFWYALEILAEHLKPAIRVPSKCPHCTGDLYCQSCEKVPLHRPYPKQALQMLVQKHVGEDHARFFKIMDEARNRLLHGEDRKVIERELDVGWEALSDDLGKLTWIVLLDTLRQITADGSPDGVTLEFLQSNTFVHYHVEMGTEAEFGAHHADPANPLIDEFQPNLEIKMIVNEHENKGQQSKTN